MFVTVHMCSKDSQRICQICHIFLFTNLSLLLFIVVVVVIIIIVFKCYSVIAFFWAILNQPSFFAVYWPQHVYVYVRFVNVCWYLLLVLAFWRKTNKHIKLIKKGYARIQTHNDDKRLQTKSKSNQKWKKKQKQKQRQWQRQKRRRRRQPEKPCHTHWL